MRALAELLDDMRTAVAAIERRHPADEDELYADELLQVWVVHQLQIIGEAASRLPAAFLEQHPEIDWSALIGMRHLLVHHYFKTDWGIVWRALVEDLPQLKTWLDKLA